MKNIFKLIIFTLLLGACAGQTPKVEITDALIEEYWHSGKTLPVEASRMYPWPDQKIDNDNGINVLMDIAHQCSFASLWDMPSRLNRLGFRSVGSMACLNSILEKGGQSRIRIYYNRDEKIYPFGWFDNPEFNVVITEQSDPKAQSYTDKEIEALDQFVSRGGGLVIMAPSLRDTTMLENWSICRLMQHFGGAITGKTEMSDGIRYAVPSGNKSWEVLQIGETRKPIAIGSKYKKGHVVIIGHPDAFRYKRDDPEEKKENVNTVIKETLLWASKGKKPVGGSSPFPVTMGGGGGIYPELEQQMGKIVLYYAENQKEDLLNCVNRDIPLAMRKVEEWLPSKSTDEPMYLILAAGDGGGWAVNAFRPKENGIISLSTFGLLSVFGHELAHTMAGPLNSKGEKAGHSPVPNQGEAHAGWFQGKVNATFDTSLLRKSNRECNKIFDKEGVLTKLDLSKHYENEEGRKIWGYGTAWNKVWYIWQKMDDRYGPTWYPRWRWIQHNRWADTPDKRLSWEEMIEDMSIAVGEDLFPFFIKLGTTLQRNKMGEVEYLGQKISLQRAPIEPTLAGNVRLEAISDYTQPLKY
ncbi:MAG: hypothetical protein LBQ60_18445 [Bacteroidales bacterium]|jgi:hypothetical protein|nr:hypothetical protein [Bacteroidales bacterium]